MPHLGVKKEEAAEYHQEGRQEARDHVVALLLDQRDPREEDHERDHDEEPQAVDDVLHLVFASPIAHLAQAPHERAQHRKQDQQHQQHAPVGFGNLRQLGKVERFGGPIERTLSDRDHRETDDRRRNRHRHMHGSGPIHIDKAGQNGLGNKAGGQNHDHCHVVVFVGDLAYKMDGQPAISHPDKEQAARTQVADRQERDGFRKGEQNGRHNGHRRNAPSDHPVEALEHSGQSHVEGRGQRQSCEEQHAGVRDLLNGIRAGEEPRPMAHQVRPYAQQRKSRHRADRKRPIPFLHVHALRHAPPLASIAG